jgi:hypothetical protein
MQYRLSKRDTVDQLYVHHRELNVDVARRAAGLADSDVQLLPCVPIVCRVLASVTNTHTVKLLLHKHCNATAALSTAQGLFC